jgi:hypothetical protein
MTAVCPSGFTSLQKRTNPLFGPRHFASISLISVWQVFNCGYFLCTSSEAMRTASECFSPATLALSNSLRAKSRRFVTNELLFRGLPRFAMPVSPLELDYLPEESGNSQVCPQRVMMPNSVVEQLAFLPQLSKPELYDLWRGLFATIPSPQKKSTYSNA